MIERDAVIIFAALAIVALEMLRVFVAIVDGHRKSVSEASRQVLSRTIANECAMQTDSLRRLSDKASLVELHLASIAEVAMATQTAIDLDEMASGGGATERET